MKKEDFASLAAFRYALRHFIAQSEKLSRESGVTQQQYQAMLAIKARATDVMSIGRLAQELFLTHHAAVQMVDRLAKLDLVRREPFEEDRRSVLVDLTPKGEALLEDLAAQHLEELRRQEPHMRRALQGLKRKSGEAPAAGAP